MTNQTIIALDTETTDKVEMDVIELAYFEATFENMKFSKIPNTTYHEYFKPNKPIAFGAMATHHILPEELEDKRPCTDISLPKIDYMIGHNIDYDWNALKQPSCRRIDTLALARKSYPNLDSHTQSALLYFLSEDKKETRKVLKNAHSAIEDINICFIILNSCLKTLKEKGIVFNSIEELYVFAEKARIPEIMPFGKYAGTPIAEIPLDYARWVCNQKDFDFYIQLAFAEQLKSGNIARHLNYILENN